MDKNKSSNSIAPPLHVQALQKHLDLGPFIDQLEHVFSKPLSESAGSNEDLPSLLSCNRIWKDLSDRKNYLSEFYNFKTVGKRKWLKNLLLEDSDSETDEQVNITDTDIKILLKIHKYRRKFQKRYHNDIMNSQSTYYAAGLLSEEDLHPEHHKYIAEQYGFSGALDLQSSSSKKPESGPGSSKIIPTSTSSVQIPPSKKRKGSLPVCPSSSLVPKPPANKRRRESAVNALTSSMGQIPASSSLTTTFPVLNDVENSSIYRSDGAIFSATDRQIFDDVATAVFNNRNSTSSETQPVISAVNDPKFKAAYKSIVMEVLPKAYNEKYIAKTYRSIVLKDIAASCANVVTQSIQQLNSLTPTEEAASAAGVVIAFGQPVVTTASSFAVNVGPNPIVKPTKKSQKKKNEFVALKHVSTPVQSPVKFNKDCV